MQCNLQASLSSEGRSKCSKFLRYILFSCVCLSLCVYVCAYVCSICKCVSVCWSIPFVTGWLLSWIPHLLIRSRSLPNSFFPFSAFSKTTVATGERDDDGGANAGNAAAAGGEGSVTGLTLSVDAGCLPRHRCHWSSYCWYHWSHRADAVENAGAAAGAEDAAVDGADVAGHFLRPCRAAAAAAVGDCYRSGPADGRRFGAPEPPFHRHFAVDSSAPGSMGCPRCHADSETRDGTAPRTCPVFSCVRFG